MKKGDAIHEANPIPTQASAKSRVPAILFGLFIGGTVGAAMIFLFTRNSRKRSRAQIQHQYDELRDQLREEVEDVEEKVMENADHVASGIRPMMK